VTQGAGINDISGIPMLFPRFGVCHVGKMALRCFATGGKRSNSFVKAWITAGSTDCPVAILTDNKILFCHNAM
jgi:hypothetical protein